jgi:hypothetical protein
MPLSSRSKRKIAGWVAGVLAAGFIALGASDDDDDDDDRDTRPGVVYEQDEDDD